MEGLPRGLSGEGAKNVRKHIEGSVTVTDRPIPGPLRFETRLGDEDMARIDEMLGEYEEATLGVLRDRLVAQLAFQRESDRWTALAQRASEDGDPAVDWQEYQEKVGPLNKRVAGAMKKLADLNRDVLEKIVNALDSVESQKLRQSLSGHHHSNKLYIRYIPWGCVML